MIDLLLDTRQHIHQNIRFLDQKALTFVVLNTALVGVVYPQIVLESSFALYFGFGACAVLSVAIGLALWVTRPRGKAKVARGRGGVDIDRIGEFDALDDYRLHLNGLAANSRMLLEELQTNVYDLAVINKAKYFWLRGAILLSAVGWALALAVAVESKL